MEHALRANPLDIPRAIREAADCKPTKAAPKVDPHFAEPIKALIEKEPSFGCRTVAWLLGFNKNTVQRVFQIKGWQVRKRLVGMRPRIEAVPSVATAPNERRSTDMCRVWAGRDGWATLALVIDCHTRELLGWHLSRSGKASTAASALEHALINRFGTLGRVTREFLLRSDNGVRHGPRTSGGTMAHSSPAASTRPWCAATA
ncbi:DDE-type integrase/transposase/recombinase [Cereibacter azotoformans]|uniref:Integrase-like protein n=1 Tax=Cereibacter azotoformans TaxID=43057 RepID=A0A2T5JMA9_9RHOB|nr:DDE-type integrase/transposase/recombinase [Cereibacter azotoformans]PTR08302.1 integrase-like protein [Cereibacter azotoformans]UIJ32838.1 DDE-type integrase/transposase/recombinase [Cereibacter azotoformans]